MQTTADVASSAKNRKRPSARLKPRQKLIAKCCVNVVGANAAKIDQLHKKNNLFYLRHQSEVAAAGESLFVLFRNNSCYIFADKWIGPV